ncbi:MAG TPA: HutD family protein [Kofleriaceae bacterium]|nr:HutD family protein [Kofleriaceae bacterium]
MQIIEPTAWRAQPWRNGAGVTHELVRWPEGEPFAVRISVADITAPAPFSAFAGYRRWLYLLEGGPVTLAHAGRDVVLAQPADGLAFTGDAQIAATAVARPGRDLNFMVREALPARVQILRGGARAELAGAAIAVFAIAGEVAVVAGAGAGAGDDRRSLRRHGCAWCTDAQIAVELGADALAAALVIER